MPQPIATAPNDETVILTDCGFCRCNFSYTVARGPIKIGYVECDPFGRIYECETNGIGKFYCDPEFWEPVPSWILEG